MKNLALLFVLIYLASCNKGITKPKGPQDLTLLTQKSLVSSTEAESRISVELRLARGYACNVSLPASPLSIFIEPIDKNGEILFKFHMVDTSSANKTLRSQLDFVRMLEVGSDKELLKELGFSERQIRKMDSKKAETLEVSTVLEFDEDDLSGQMYRNSVTKDVNGKVVKRTSQRLGALKGCLESELEVEVASR